MALRRTVAISMGDPSGIGPEVLAAALATEEVRAAVRPVVFGDPGIWDRACGIVGAPGDLEVVLPGQPVPPSGGLVAVSSLPPEAIVPGVPSPLGGRAQKDYLEAALAAVLDGSADALCTGPIHKASIREAGFPFPGHTEFLQERMGVERVVMMLAGPVLRVALATTHCPLSEVASRLSPSLIEETLAIVHRALVGSFGVASPKIAVCGLNPHAGERGLFGREEEDVIGPGIERARGAGIDASGPFPADGLFPLAARGGWDAVLAMYHDQGLIPVKTVHRETAVNVTLGLPIPRTSPDHGVAYDIAGKGVADPSSTIHALLLAARLVRR